MHACGRPPEPLRMLTFYRKRTAGSCCCTLLPRVDWRHEGNLFPIWRVCPIRKPAFGRLSTGLCDKAELTVFDTRTRESWPAGFKLAEAELEERVVRLLQGRSGNDAISPPCRDHPDESHGAGSCSFTATVDGEKMRIVNDARLHEHSVRGGVDEVRKKSVLIDPVAQK